MYNFVVTKTPLRVSFLGGGTDIANFYEKNEGAVLSSAIDKYVYVSIKRYSKLYKTKFRLNYSITENTNHINKIKNNIVRECLKIFEIKFPIYISIISDIPAGSGLGGSSSVVVGLLKALCTILNKKITKQKLYELACYIEIKILKQPIGKQDQFPAVYGGMNFIKFKKNGAIIAKRISLKKFNPKLFSSSILMWTENTRSATKELKFQEKNFKKNEKYLLKIKKNLYDFKFRSQFKNVNLKEFGFYINQNGQQKLNMIRLKNYRFIEKIFYSKKNNFYGSKLLGAGGGGFYYILAKKKELNILKKKLTSTIFLRVNISRRGTSVICKN
jgi:D-glycero-alpha-D-manno-heptose-7-phosphate kinase